MDSLYRKKIKTSNENIKFQILSWETFDEEIDSEFELEYKIYVFGVTERGNSISVRVDGYTPYFYVKIQENLQDSWNDYKTNEVKNYLKKKLFAFKNSLLKVSVVLKKDIGGFTNEKEFKFLKIITTNEKVFKKCRYILSPGNNRPKPVIPLITPQDLNFDIYEANIDPFIRLCHIKNLKLAGWCEISKYTSGEDLSRCQIDISCKWNHLNPLDKSDISKIRIASYDIECISERAKRLHKNIFPDYSLSTDIITQIGTTFHTYGTNETIEHMCTINSEVDKKVDPVQGVIIEVFDTEKELLQGWINLIRKTDPDFITGYNINGFDWNYIHERCRMQNMELSLAYLSRLNDHPAYFKEEKLVSNAYGENNFKYMYCYGLLNSDLHTIIKREQKLESYKLDNVAKIHIGDKKDDITPMDIFNMATGTASEIATVIKYCAKDCTLVVNLIKKLSIIPNMIAMANVTWVPITYIESRGQQIKVHSQLLYEARLNDYLVPTLPYKATSDPSDDEKFTGATVLTATPGAHFEQISGLDFASLYPSIMIAQNLSYETIVKDPRYDNLESVVYNDIIWTEDEGEDTERVEKVRFSKNKKGILPIMLEKLWTERKAIKKQMKGVKKQIEELKNEIKEIGEIVNNVEVEDIGDIENNENETETETGSIEIVQYPNRINEINEEIEKLEAQYSVLDGFQLAMKVSMNSIYGFTGANLGRLPEKRIAASVTATGRAMIKQCKEHVEKTYDCEVIYGDSVVSYTPILIRHNKQVKIITIDELDTLDALISSDSIDSTDCRESMKRWRKMSREKNLNKIGEQQYEHEQKQCYELNNIQTWTEKGWTDIKRIIRHKLSEHKKIIRVHTDISIVDCTDDHSLLLADGTEISPRDIKIGNELLHKRLYKHEDRHYMEHILHATNQLDAARICHQADLTGKKYTIENEKDTYIIKILRCYTPTNKVIKIEEIEYDGYVYDLTTENHHFQAGIGNMIVHNTDSIYVKFKTEYTGQQHMDEVFRLSEEAALACSDLFIKPIDLEFEKVMWPFILFSKKRYACVIWTNQYKHDYIDYKGIQVVRRDNCPLIKEKSKEIFECILLQRDIPKAITMARIYSKDLLDGNYAIKDLIISKSLKGYGSYEFDKQVICEHCKLRWYQLEDFKKKYKIPLNEKKSIADNVKEFISKEHFCYTCNKDTKFKMNPANIAHVALARKMEERDPYNCPQAGERVPYVFKITNSKRDKQFEKVEDPDYVIRNCIPIDYEYYFEHQLKSALDTIFEPILKENMNKELYEGIIPEKPIKVNKTAENKELAEKKTAEKKELAEKKTAEKKELAEKKTAEKKELAEKKIVEKKELEEKKTAEKKELEEKKEEKPKRTRKKKEIVEQVELD